MDHAILLYKLEAIGFDMNSVSWFASYLYRCKQVVDINGTCSNFVEVTCGVPQGSIFGSLLFLIYVNSMKGATDCQLASVVS